jgi:hypothetical protein
MQYNYSKKMLTQTTKPIRMNGDPDNQRLDMWSFAVPGNVSG